MGKVEETPQQTQDLLFGFGMVRDWLSKAYRERDRFLSEPDRISKTDHVINLAITLSHLEDWVYRIVIQGNVAEWPDQQSSKKWIGWVREQCPAMLSLADLCNAAKHRVLHRRGSSAEKAVIGPVNYIIDDTKYVIQFMSGLKDFSYITNIRIVIDDGVVSYIEISTDVHKISAQNGFRLFIDVANEAIRFWDDFPLTRGL